MVAGIRQAESAAVLGRDLFAQNLILLDNRTTLGSFGKMFSLAGRAGRRELRDFTLHVATCLSAGIPIISALRDFERDSASGPFKDIIADIREDIAAGMDELEASVALDELAKDVAAEGIAEVAVGSAEVCGQNDEVCELDDTIAIQVSVDSFGLTVTKVVR